MAAPSIFAALATVGAQRIAGEIIAANTVRAAAIQAIPRAINEGISRRAFRDLLRETFGQAYRWQTMLNDWQRVAGLLRNEARIRALPDNVFIPRSYYTQTTLRRDRRYRVHGVGTFLDNNTGEVSFRRVSFYDNIERGADGWRDRYNEVNPSLTSAPDESLEDLFITNIEHNQGWTY